VGLRVVAGPGGRGRDVEEDEHPFVNS
jgi:hypothetical protein